jgi:hypothetical protein
MNKEYLRESILFIILLLFCGFYFFFDLGNLSAEMWDESRNAINALEMRYDHSFFVTHFDGQPDMWNTKPPLFIWATALCMKLFGTTVFALRFPSALSAFFIAIYCFWFSRKYLNNVLPGFFAGLVLATSVGFVDYHVARNGDFDCMLSMWIFFYCTQFFLYLESQKKKHLILASLFLACAILTKGIAGCLFLPGLFLFSVINKKHRTIFKKKELYIITLLGFASGISYYFIREFYNHGYIAAVIENEITGRYANAIENHSGDNWFYFRILNDNHFAPWLYWLLPSFLITVYANEEQYKQPGKFLIVTIICNLIILTLSETKLKWYDAPLFPFMALLIGLGLSQIYNAVIKILNTQKQLIHILFFILFTLGIFASSTNEMSHTSVFRKKEQNFNALFFGDFLENYFAYFPRQKSLKIISYAYGYNPHLFFYTKKYQHEGYNIHIISVNDTIKNHDTVMLCDTDIWPKLDTGFMFDTLYQEGNNKFIFTAINLAHPIDSISVVEKKLFHIMDEIKNNPEWFSNVQEKSKKEKIDLKQQLMYDALYHLVIHKMMSIELQGILKKKYGLLK